MSSLVGDLWPADLVKPLAATPLSIMKEQAARLAGKTGDLVQADVTPKVSGSAVFLNFDLVMPLLENYRYNLITVIHSVDGFFPLTLKVLNKDVKVEDQAAFVEHIRDALSSDRVKNVIRTFVDMQSQEPRPHEIAG